MVDNVRRTSYCVFFGFTALAVFFAGSVLGFIGIRVIAFLVFGEATDPWGHIGGQLIDSDSAACLGAVFGTVWLGYVISRACRENTQSSYFHRHLWPAAAVLVLWIFLRFLR